MIFGGVIGIFAQMSTFLVNNENGKWLNEHWAAGAILFTCVVETVGFFVQVLILINLN